MMRKRKNPCSALSAPLAYASLALENHYHHFSYCQDIWQTIASTHNCMKSWSGTTHNCVWEYNLNNSDITWSLWHSVKSDTSCSNNLGEIGTWQLQPAVVNSSMGPTTSRRALPWGQQSRQSWPASTWNTPNGLAWTLPWSSQGSGYDTLMTPSASSERVKLTRSLNTRTVSDLPYRCEWKWRRMAYYLSWTH